LDFFLDFELGFENGLKDGLGAVPVPSGMPVREARLDNKLVSLEPGFRQGQRSAHRRAFSLKTPDSSADRKLAPEPLAYAI
jgi:hypothetical protein